jgi:hypothetical protein
MASLPIVKMTLYKHGVGYYERRGQVDEDTVSLVFMKDEMSDILKSLTAFTVGGGQVLGMDYQTPEDKPALLARSSIQLSAAASLRDLLRDLRGRLVKAETPSQTLTGVMVGVDLPGEREPMSATVLSIYVPAAAQVHSLALDDLMALTLLDTRAAEDLTYFLETSKAAENKRAVTIRLTPGRTDLVASYIAPSPTWRVSYRLVTDDAGNSSQALLQGWGLFDNTFDEDLENVQLSFVAGMPVSFIYDLYTPYTPPRPVVTEEARVVAGPVEFEASLRSMAEEAPMALGAAAPTSKRTGARLMAADVAESTAVAATGQAQGEFFSYVVANPVTVRRGRSAMVPILQARLGYHKERIYNGRKQPVNPVITARFTNETGLTLERGPVTVVEGGEYAGEAMLPFTGPGNDIFLAYAVDLGVKVSEAPAAEQVLVAVNLEHRMLSIQEYNIQRIVYTVDNRNEQPVEVLIEHPRLPEYTPFDTPEPAETTADTYRYRVRVKPHATVTFTAQQRRLVARREELRNQRASNLQRWLRDRVLDAETFAVIERILAQYDQITEHEAELKRNETQRQNVFNQQKQVQGNLASLRDQGEEGQLRARYTRTLNQLEDELQQLRERDEALRQAITQAKQRIDEILSSLPA